MSAFPTSPVNGQTANVNGVLYTYSSALTAWAVTSGGGALTVATAVSATGNITGNYFIGNGSQLTGVASVGTLATLSVTGNTTTGNLLTGGLVSATGNITSAANVIGGNLVGTLANGTSNLAIVSSGNILLTVAGTANVATFTSTGIASTRVTPRVADNGATTSGSITPTGNTADQYNILGLTGNITIETPSGTPTDGQKLTLRIKDNGVARGITWSNIYREISTTLPVTTSVNKVTYVGCIYNSTDVYWDVIAVATQA